jgi:hypothetical protein
MKHHPGTSSACVSAVSEDLGCLATNLLTNLLELGVWLPCRRDRSYLSPALARLAAPGPIETEIAMAVELVQQGKREDHTIASTLIGGEDLNPATGPQGFDPAIAIENAEPFLQPWRSLYKPGRLTVQPLALIARGSPEDNLC